MREILDAYVETSLNDGALFSEEKVSQFSRNYRRFFPSDSSAAVLDIGIGRGEMLGLMRQWGFHRYHGIDVSPSTVAHCRARGLTCELTDDCGGWLKEHPGTYAVITLLDVIEHLEKPALIPFLRAIHEALIPGGILIVQTPNLQAPEAYLHRYQDITHHVGFGEHALRQVALAAGFVSIECFGFETMVFLGWTRIRSYSDLSRRLVRTALFPVIRLMRLIVGNPNPRILHPVLAAAIRRN